MTGRSDSSLAAILLTQRLVESTADPLKASEYWDLLSLVSDPATLLGADVATIISFGVLADSAARLRQRLEAATSLAFELDRMEQSGIRVVASVDDEYPAGLAALGHGAPPLLYVAGDTSLLAADLLGVVGSRDVAEHAADAAAAAAREAARNGVGVVSGGAPGVDRLAMSAAVDAGAVSVGVMADSLLRTVRDPEVRRAVIEGSACLCTPYKPSAGFSGANAMGRNKLIYALSVATLVVASEVESGGTWAGAVEALRAGIAPVIAWVGEGATPGNERLTTLGAVPLRAVEDLFPLPSALPIRVVEPPQQLTLDV